MICKGRLSISYEITQTTWLVHLLNCEKALPHSKVKSIAIFNFYHPFS